LGSGRLIAFLDDDTVATEQWAAEGVRAFEGVPDVVGLVGRTALPPGEGKNPFLHFMVQEREGSFPACNMWVRRDSFWKSGGFSPDFFDPRSRVFHHEDSDFAFRLQELGKVVFSSAVVAFHPACPAGLLEPIRMSRKAYFDALLARKHPRKYAELMTKRVGFLSLPNPRVKARFLLVALALGGFACALAGYGKTAWGLLAMGFVCLSGLVALRTDFRGLLRMSLVELVLLYPVTLAAAFMFVGSLVRGMIRFRRLVW
jgi:GT2 family glycosyltransferase